jgi:ATP-dependent DNA ligase
MLAELAREVPRGPYLYEPKWDGFRCLAFVAGGEVELRSRHDRPLARYFPEVVDALRPLSEAGCVLDGEIVVLGAGGSDFAALMNRTHPAASRVRRLAAETPATLVAFDLLSRGDEDLTAAPFCERRARLEVLLAPDRTGVRLTPATDDADEAAMWAAGARRGIDGVVAKRLDLTYQPGRRAMIKVKPERTAECVVAGVRLLAGAPPLIGSLLLGLWDGALLRHVGVVSNFPRARRRELVRELGPLAARLAGHPWENGFQLERSPMGRLPGAAARWEPGAMTLDWVPLRAERVAEVAYDHLDGQRFRHPARFVRWRPDRDPGSCTFEQLP